MLAGSSASDEGAGSGWLLLFKAHRAAGKLTGAATAALSVAAVAWRRIAAGWTNFDSDAPLGESSVLRTRFYAFLRAFLLLSMLLLTADVAAHAQGWHLAVLPDLDAVEGLFAAGYSAWMRARAAYLGPALQFLTTACVVLFMIQSADRLILCLAASGSRSGESSPWSTPLPPPAKA